MKSIVMAVFLLSVSLGNVFTAVVNHFIQTPAIAGVIEGISPEGLAAGSTISGGDFTATVLEPGESQSTPNQLLVAGPDDAVGTDDDVVLTIGPEGELTALSNASKPIFEQAAEKIEQAYFEGASTSGDSLPSVDEITTLLGDLRDAHGNPIRYKLVSRDRYQLISSGADGVDGTKWDETLSGALQRTTNDDRGESSFNWIERRKIELLGQGDPTKIAQAQADINADHGGGSETKFSRDYAIGGRVLLEGASYFWFWTMCIFVTAVLFVPVGYLYKEKTYIQDESENEDEEDVNHQKSLADEALSS